MKNQQTLEWNLDTFMEKHKLTVAEVSKRTNIHPNVISRIKNNRQHRIDLYTIERLLLGLNISPNELFRYVYKED
ncbi:MAG TPA: helix-turn-helix transcriptional regulator [Metabacillus sp.]|nr:helix-turn-helix transcriptional regulator [Metabacillus sp.]